MPRVNRLSDKILAVAKAALILYHVVGAHLYLRLVKRKTKRTESNLVSSKVSLKNWPLKTQFIPSRKATSVWKKMRRCMINLVTKLMSKAS